MTSSLSDRLHRLTAIFGPAGRETRIAATLGEMIQPYVDEVRTDLLGNLIAIKRGAPGSRRIMLAAHMDTIGALAITISDKGLIHLAPVGGMKAQYAIGQRVVWQSGAVGILQHEPAEEPKEIDFKKLFCDIGATSRDEALESVRPGDMCVLTGELQLMGDFITGPGLDNRAGCAVLLEVAEHLVESEHELVFAFTAQGEVGPRGAGVAAFGVQPEVCFVVDLAPSGDVPRGPRVDMKLGGGPALKLKDGNYMAHQALTAYVRQVAEEHRIPLQTEIIPSGTGHNDAQVVSVSGAGVATAVIDVPVRYRGTAAEMVNLRDLHGAADLLMKLVQGKVDLA